MTNESYESSQTGLSIDLHEYALLLWHWAWLILLAAVIAGGTAYYLKGRDVPLYRASTVLLVSDPPTITNMNTSQSAIVPSNLMAQTYVQMIKDLPVLQQVVDRLQIPLNPLTLKGMINATVIAQTQLIQVTVTDTNPARAVAIANALGDVFSNSIKDLQATRYGLSQTNLTTQLTDMETELQQIEAQLALATDPQEKTQLETKQTQYRQIYANLLTSLAQLQVAQSQSTTMVVQVDPATTPYSPVNQSSLQYPLLAALVAALLACGVVVTANLLDGSVRSPEELIRQLDLPILGVIPHHTVKDAAPVTQVQPYSSVSEAYRTLRTNLEHANPEHTLHRILVASPLPEDGKTTVIANLATIMAQGGQHTVLLDGDMRWPRTHRALGLPNRSGLSNLIVQPDSDQNEAVQATQLKNLILVSSGPLPPNPADLLGSARMAGILEWLNQQSDILLIDTPPALTVTDASVLALQVDGILIVVKAGKTKLNSVKRLVTTLRQQGARLLGVVVNDIKFKNVRYRYYYRDYYTNSARLRSGKGKKNVVKPQAPAPGK